LESSDASLIYEKFLAKTGYFIFKSLVGFLLSLNVSIGLKVGVGGVRIVFCYALELIPLLPDFVLLPYPYIVFLFYN
jgi:hypothetical protein